jgi:hypothetical protein
MAMGARMSAAVAATEFRRKAMKAAGVISLCALAIAVSGCVPGYVKENDSPVLFRIVSINSGQTLVSDVSTVAPDVVTVTVAVRPKNPLNTNVPQVAEAVIVEQYRVRFFRTDGRDVEGVDVPFSFTGGITTAVDIGTGSAANVALAIPLIRVQAKQESPLRNLRSLVAVGGQQTTGGVLVPRVTMTAEITIFGRTIAGEAVSDTGRVTIDFVDLP